jgi:hypothetical protein
MSSGRNSRALSTALLVPIRHMAPGQKPFNKRASSNPCEHHSQVVPPALLALAQVARRPWRRRERGAVHHVNRGRQYNLLYSEAWHDAFSGAEA